MMEQIREVLTPEQAAEYLQVNRETIYRYIRQGKLVASKLGRTYRVPRRSLDLLLWATRTRDDITLREYTGDEMAEFLETWIVCTLGLGLAVGASCVVCWIIAGEYVEGRHATAYSIGAALFLGFTALVTLERVGIIK